MHPNTPAPFLLAPPHRTGLCDSGQSWRVTFSRVRNGVVEGRMVRFGTAGHADRWALFQTSEQFAACAAHDPLRFADPLMFVRVKKEFDHVYSQQADPDPDAGR